MWGAVAREVVSKSYNKGQWKVGDADVSIITVAFLKVRAGLAAVRPALQCGGVTLLLSLVLKDRAVAYCSFRKIAISHNLLI